MNSNDGNAMDLRCVNCGWGIERLYVQYSPGNIRLMKCESCMTVADPYIECEFMGIFWKSGLINVLLDSYRTCILKGSKTDWDFSRGLLLPIWACGKVLADAILGNLIFISVLLLRTRFLLNSGLAITRHEEILLAILVSSYFKLFLLAVMVWEFPSSVIFIIDIFVLSSNCAALKVLTQSRITECVGVCFSAHMAKFFTIHWLPILVSFLLD